MFTKGGYKLIDLKETPITLSGAAVKVDGIYDSIEAANRKPTILTGIVIDSVEKPNAWVNFYTSGANFAAIIGKTSEGADMTMTVTSEDMITIA